MDDRKLITQLKQKRNAVILAHNYQRAEVQEVADFVGDSLGLALEASNINADVIVFCGVDFMAESAKILNPDKIILHPEPRAKCPMAAMCEAKDLVEFRARNPDAKIVGYVNTTASCKAQMDLCCTSSNAIKVVESTLGKDILFVPDENLGKYIKRFVSDKNVILWPGYCPTHHAIIPEDITNIKKEHPEALVIVHPECRPEVIDLADAVRSTDGMIKFVRDSRANEFIIGTEVGLIHRLKRENPDKSFYGIPSAVCPSMKMITLSTIRQALETLSPRIELDKKLIEMARVPLERMTRVGRSE
ncbi:MAG: quinolinate synthase NadA [Methanomassiliicoccales archaeon]